MNNNNNIYRAQNIHLRDAPGALTNFENITPALAVLQHLQ